MAITVNNIVTAVRDRLDEATAGQWTNTQIKRWLNEALRDLARKTKHIKSTTTFTTTAGVAEYTAATNIIEIEHAYYAPGDGRQIPLIPRAWDGMNNIWGQQQNQSGGDPMMWTTWGVPPALKVRLYPVPSESSKTVTLYVTRLATAVTEDESSDTTTVDFPEAWVDLTKDFIEYCALRKDRDPRWQEAFQFYAQRVDDLIVNSDYMNAPMEMIADPLVAGGVVPRWLADASWGDW
jgi:hypothetical protein